ncbi:sensor histidine kinase [Pseudoneobacillus sp. C159]
MFRNGEIRVYLLILGIISVIAFMSGAYLFSIKAGLLILITAALLISCSLLFTAWRYREIENLSKYLRRIANGDYSLDVRDNHEGELSILKSEIYKVNLMLSEHGTLLKEDKKKLTNAISDISHQIKTPLTSMLMMADLLSDANLNETKRQEFTHSIRVQLERMEWLVSSLLKLSKIDAGTISFKKDQVFVQQLLNKAIETVLIPMDIKQQSFLIQGEMDVSFQGDLKWTTEAIINILKNCVEHTPEGGEIVVSFSDNPLYTSIIIEDNGKGISKKDLPYIFKRFYKGENAGEDSVGIGLAMANSIVTAQSGYIEVSSEIGMGTRFHIKFYKRII